ncbi:MAG: hypothetical protein RL150_555 [Candidatus Parcubacteria bacterium]|jgi:hypothetical protein
MSHESFPAEVPPQTDATPSAKKIEGVAPVLEEIKEEIAPVERQEKPETTVDTIAEPGSERLSTYWKNRETTESAYEAARVHNTELTEIRTRLGITESVDAPKEEAELLRLEIEMVEAQANYPGHPTLLLHERLQHPDIRQRFIDIKTAAREFMHDDRDERNWLQKSNHFKSHYTKQLEAYDENVRKVFSSTETDDAETFRRSAHNLGRSVGVGSSGTVFSDAVHRDGTPLTTRQKAIIEAHEKGHGMRDFVTSREYSDLISTLDHEKMRAYRIAENGRPNGYMQKPEEIAERMSQLKNYFGFKGAEVFTKQHLEHARRHYVADTGLDNMMSEFFTGITPETEEQFLKAMNTYPI